MLRPADLSRPPEQIDADISRTTATANTVDNSNSGVFHKKVVEVWEGPLSIQLLNLCVALVLTPRVLMLMNRHQELQEDGYTGRMFPRVILLILQTESHNSTS